VMSIVSTNRKNTNVWGIPSMETYLTSIMIRKKRHREDCCAVFIFQSQSENLIKHKYEHMKMFCLSLHWTWERDITLACSRQDKNLMFTETTYAPFWHYISLTASQPVYTVHGIINHKFSKSHHQ
jgi:hypothetical protein